MGAFANYLKRLWGQGVIQVALIYVAVLMARVVDETVAGFRRVGFIDDSTDIVTTWSRRLEYGYPTPWLARDGVLNAVLPELERCGIYSRGRFGAWKYEVSNQDHSAMQGVEAIDHFLAGIPENDEVSGLRHESGHVADAADCAAARPDLRCQPRPARRRSGEIGRAHV